jgi:hypothetical protein
MCRCVLFITRKDDSKKADKFMGLMEYLDIVDVGGPAAIWMDEGRDGCDTKQSWEMIREVKRIILGG